MRFPSAALTTLLAAASLATTVSVSHAQTCQDLWVERNQYYKEAGYCFHTPRAIKYFGNAGCRYDDEGVVPLPRGVRERIAEISRTERNFRCSS